MTENGRPPDISQGPETLKGRIEQYMADGEIHGLEQIAEACGGDSKTSRNQTSRAIRSMADDGLVTELPFPGSKARKNFRWSSFELADPTSPLDTQDWLHKDESIMFDLSGPIGARTRLAYQWYRITDVGKFRLEHIPIVMGDLTDAEVEVLVQDLAMNLGHMDVSVGAHPGDKRGGPMSGHALVMYMSADGVDGAGMRSLISRWIGGVSGHLPQKLWLPECIVALPGGGYAIHPHLAPTLKMVSAIPGFFPGGPWAAPTEVVNQCAAQAGNIWRSRSFEGATQ